MTKPVEKTIEMTKAQFQKWDDALCSGKFTQASGDYINMDDNGTITAYCCLAVLEKTLSGSISDKSESTPNNAFMKRHNITFRKENGDSTSTDKYGNDPYLGGNRTAINLNDDEGLSFKQIAQRLRARVKFISAKKKVVAKKATQIAAKKMAKKKKS